MAMKERRYEVLVFLMWLFAGVNVLFMMGLFLTNKELLALENMLICVLPFLVALVFACALSRCRGKEKLEEHFSNHESKRHFQVIQSLLYLEKYEDVKLYIKQIDID